MAIADAVHGVPEREASKPYMTQSECFTALQILLVIFAPPVAVCLEVGCNEDLLINVLLTLIMYLPGMLHAAYIVFKNETRLEQLQQAEKQQQSTSRWT